MPNRKPRQWPPLAKVMEIIKERGGIDPAARKMKVPPTSLRSFLDRNGMLAEARVLAAGTPTEIPDHLEEIEILEQRVRDAEKRLKEQRYDDVWEERVIRRLEDAVTQTHPRYAAPKPQTAHKGDPHEFGLLFSDTHAGEVVESEATLGMNDYGWDPMLARMKKLQRGVLSYQENRPYPVETLNVWMLGDMLSGDIHEELKITNDRTVEESVVDFGEECSRWLEGFVPHFQKIRIVCVPGNHPRRAKQPSSKQPYASGDWLTYNYAKIKLASYGDQFEWDIPRSTYGTALIAGRWRVLLMHGDGIRTTMPGVPWGGVVRRVTTLEQQFAKAEQPIDYVVMGHFHTANALDGVGTKTFINGSVKGVDEYSLRNFGSGRSPCQLLLTMHADHGVTDVSYIDLA